MFLDVDALVSALVAVHPNCLQLLNCPRASRPPGTGSQPARRMPHERASQKKWSIPIPAANQANVWEPTPHGKRNRYATGADVAIADLLGSHESVLRQAMDAEISSSLKLGKINCFTP